GLSFPTSVAVRNGSLYIADTGNNRVLRFPAPFSGGDVFPDLVIGQPNFTSRNPNYTGQVSEKGVFLAGSGQAFRAAIAFDSAGNLYLTDTGNRRVLRYSAQDLAGGGPVVATLEIGQLDFTSVADPLPAQNPSQAAQSQQARDQFAAPVSLAFDASGNLYVADRDLNRILLFRPPFANRMSASRIMGVVLPVPQGQPPVPQDTLDRTVIGPLGVVALPGNAGIAVLDAASNRILIFDPPGVWESEDTRFSPRAKLQVGHTDFNNRQPNNAQPAPSPLSFTQPS